MSTLRLSYLVLGLVCARSIIVYNVLSPTSEGLRGFALNLATEMLGILLTIGLIDTVIRRREEREQRRYRSVALRQLRHPLNRHLFLLFEIYKASVEEKPDRKISRVADLFGDDYLTQISWFDVESQGPMSIGSGSQTKMLPWYEYLHMEINKFKDELSRVVDKYATHLDPDPLDIYPLRI